MRNTAGALVVPSGSGWVGMGNPAKATVFGLVSPHQKSRTGAATTLFDP